MSKNRVRTKWKVHMLNIKCKEEVYNEANPCGPHCGPNLRLEVGDYS